MVVQGHYTWIIDEQPIPLSAGDEYFIEGRRVTLRKLWPESGQYTYSGRSSGRVTLKCIIHPSPVVPPNNTKSTTYLAFSDPHSVYFPQMLSYASSFTFRFRPGRRFR
jgi:hypothetical protein